MISRLPASIRGIISLSFMVINTIVWAIPIHLLALTKILVRNTGWQRICARAIMSIGNCWIRGILMTLKLTQGTAYEIEGLEGLSRDKWYFINCNHQSWSDILILFRVFHGHVPFLKFFLKKQLFWVPLMGIAWWALDYPFMERFSRSYLEKNPHMRGKDLETTRKACSRYQHTPVAILNFIEGTRFTHEKHSLQQSPYQHLLRPKSGGFAFALAAMNGRISNILDVTIIYPSMRFNFWDYLCGRIPHIIVKVKKLPVPGDFLEGDYQNDDGFRDRFQLWVCDLWQVKDNLIDQHRNGRLGY
jgi:1-acyl-sn-glycerol-3-phosphate acyltransferase